MVVSLSPCAFLIYNPAILEPTAGKITAWWNKVGLKWPKITFKETLFQILVRGALLHLDHGQTGDWNFKALWNSLEALSFQWIEISKTQWITIFSPSNLKKKMNSQIAVIIKEPAARHKDYENVSLSCDPFNILWKNSKTFYWKLSESLSFKWEMSEPIFTEF